jgi:hypothetical protein
MGFLDLYLPASVWQFELFLALFTTVLLLLQLFHALPPVSQIHYIPYVTIPLSTLLLLDSYLTLSHLESLYASSPSGRGVIDGYTLNERRFREQRDCYLSMFTLVVSVVLRLTEGIVGDVHKLRGRNYQLQTRLDKAESKGE